MPLTRDFWIPYVLGGMKWLGEGEGEGDVSSEPFSHRPDLKCARQGSSKVGKVGLTISLLSVTIKIKYEIF